MSSIELQVYVRDLAAEVAEQLRVLVPAERQDVLFNKMAMLQTYLTSTGHSDEEALRLSLQFQALVGELVASESSPGLSRECA